MELKIGQEVYYIQREKIIVCKIRSIIRKEIEKGEVVLYEIEDFAGRKREVSGAYLVADWDMAKQASIINWEMVVKTVTNQIKNQTKITFKQEKKKYQKYLAEKKKKK